MKIIEDLKACWSGLAMPQGFIADISDPTEATHELGDVETYFRGRHWSDVDPEDREIGYMCPLYWMNENAAKYYSLSYLVYLYSIRAIKSEHNVAENTVHYFESDLSILAALSREQQALANRVICDYRSSAQLIE